MKNPLCPLCGLEGAHKFTMPVDAKTFKPTKHGAIYECARCLFGFVHPRPTAEETNKFYDLDAYYTQGASHMVNTPAPRFSSRLRNHLAWRVDRGRSLLEVMIAELPQAASVVDIGCGSGALLQAMSKLGYCMTGVERDADSLSFPNVLEGSAEALPAELPRGAYDGVVFSHVIEHLVDPIEAIRHAAALLSPSGKLFCEVPNNEAAIAMQSGLSWEHLDVPRHINFFTERSLKRLIQQSGLIARQIYFRGYCRYFGDSYIATEQRIHDRLPSGHGSVRNSQAHSWRLLARTAFARSARKYDSVGIVASF